jgi:GNAT superfamily N-acetyltransferase
MSVWESVEALKSYVYRSEHVEFFRRRSEWFEADAKRVALWHLPAGTIPELDEAVRRVEFLERNGPSPYSFGFAQPPEPLIFETTTKQGRMIRARFGGRLVGSGAVRHIGDGIGEIKGMFVAQEFRGAKIGAAILDQLEMHALRLGLSQLKLETGANQKNALNLYQGFGFQPCEPWGEYLASSETSLCFAKSLATAKSLARRTSVAASSEDLDDLMEADPCTGTIVNEMSSGRKP